MKFQDKRAIFLFLAIILTCSDGLASNPNRGRRTLVERADTAVIPPPELTTTAVDEWSVNNLWNSLRNRVSSLFYDEESAPENAIPSPEGPANITVSRTGELDPSPSQGRYSTSGPLTNALLRRLDRVQMCMGVVSGQHNFQQHLESDQLLRSFMLCPLSDAFSVANERIDLSPTDFCGCVREREVLAREQGIGAYERVENPANRSREIRSQVVAPAIISMLSRYDALIPQINYGLSAIEFRHGMYSPSNQEAILSGSQETLRLESTPIYSCAPTQMSSFLDDLTSGDQPTCSSAARDRLMGVIQSYRECQEKQLEGMNCLEDVTNAVLNEIDADPQVAEAPSPLSEGGARAYQEAASLGGSCLSSRAVCTVEANTAYQGVLDQVGSSQLFRFTMGLGLGQHLPPVPPLAANLDLPPSPLDPSLGSAPEVAVIPTENDVITTVNPRSLPEAFRLRLFQAPSADEVANSWQEGVAYYQSVVTTIVQHMLDHQGNSSNYRPSEEHLHLIRMHIARNPHLSSQYPSELRERMLSNNSPVTWSEIARPYLAEIEERVFNPFLRQTFGEESARTRRYSGVSIDPSRVLTLHAFSMNERMAQMTSSCIQVKETLGSLCHALDDDNDYGQITSLAMSEPLLETLLGGVERSNGHLTPEMAEQYHSLMVDSSMLLCSEHNRQSAGGTRDVSYIDPLINLRETHLRDLYTQRLAFERDSGAGEPSPTMARTIGHSAVLSTPEVSRGVINPISEMIEQQRREHFHENFVDPLERLRSRYESASPMSQSQSIAQAIESPHFITANEQNQPMAVESSPQTPTSDSASSVVDVNFEETMRRAEASALINPGFVSTSVQAAQVDLANDPEAQEREELASRLEQNQEREKELRERLNEIENRTTPSSSGQMSSEQLAMFQEIRDQLEQLRIENELMRQRLVSLPERPSEQVAVTEQASPTPTRQPASRMMFDSNAPEEFASSAGEQSPVARAETIRPSAMARGSFAPTASGTNNAIQTLGRVGDARFTNLQANNSLVLTTNVFNSDTSKTMLALRAVGAVAYRRTTNPAIIERILFKTSNNGAIEFNERGEPVIQSVEQVQASLVEFLPADEANSLNVISGRSPASVDTAALENERSLDRTPIRYFQLEQIILESFNENP